MVEEVGLAVISRTGSPARHTEAMQAGVQPHQAGAGEIVQEPVGRRLGLVAEQPADAVGPAPEFAARRPGLREGLSRQDIPRTSGTPARRRRWIVLTAGRIDPPPM